MSPRTSTRDPNTGPTKLTLSIPECASRLGVGERLIWDNVHAGRLPSLRLGRRTLIPLDSLGAALRDLTSGGPDPRP
jgi:excisionase family DNA binding protein